MPLLNAFSLSAFPWFSVPVAFSSLSFSPFLFFFSCNQAISFAFLIWFNLIFANRITAIPLINRKEGGAFFLFLEVAFNLSSFQDLDQNIHYHSLQILSVFILFLA